MNVWGVVQYSPLDIDALLPIGLTRTLEPQVCADVCYLEYPQTVNSKHCFVFATADELRKWDLPILDLDKDGKNIILRGEALEKALAHKNSAKPKVTAKPKVKPKSTKKPAKGKKNEQRTKKK